MKKNHNDKNRVSNKYVRVPTGRINWSYFSLDRIIDDYEGFRVILDNYKTSSIVRIGFTTPIVYRYSNESYRLVTNDDTNGDSELGLFEVQQSTLIDWLRGENGNHSNDSWKHYVIVSDDEYTDVVIEESSMCGDLPKVDVLVE
ncbi:hypothetical protein JD969_00785 [Planctomycetota bacterium]|nr:hypothetical protein JD969_00785 [Planctomycetota bacterium]